MRRLKDTSGQMTVELVVVLPVLIAIAVIATNALEFFSFCASFDRAAHNAVRVCAVSPAYGQDAAQSNALVEGALRNSYRSEENIRINVRSSSVLFGYREFVATADFYPTLFGMPLRSDVMGVALPYLSHSTRFVVDYYKPGVIV